MGAAHVERSVPGVEPVGDDLFHRKHLEERIYVDV